MASQVQPRADAAGQQQESSARSLARDDVTCSICLRNRRDAADPCVTSCGHSFCRACLEKAMDHGLSCCPLCRADMSRFNVFSSENGNPLARRDVQTIWGTHFVQANTCGLASYHFAADGSGAWIEYNHDLIPSSWRLDNGQVPPRRKDFSEFSYDPLQRVFKGCINWTPFAFSGHDKWVYCMEFNEKFTGIVGGFIKAYRPDGALGEEMTFGPDLTYRRVRESIFDATYVQSTVLSSLLPHVEAMVGKASYHFTRDGSWISYASAPETWKLDSGARIPLKKNFQNISYDHDARIFRGVIDWSDDPIANATRWEYEMHFDPSFRTLREGTVRTVDVNGTSEIRRFGVDMSYVLHDEEDAPCCT